MPPRYIEIAAKGHMVMPDSSTRPIVNVFHYATSGTPVVVNKLNVGAAFIAQVWPDISAALNAAYIGDDLNARMIDDATDPYVLVGVPTNGQVTGDPYSLQSAVTVQLKTATRGRIAKGSKHFGPLSESDTPGNELAGSGLANWLLVADQLISSFTDADGNIWLPQVLSRKPPAQYTVNPTNVVSNTIIGFVLNKTIGTMRRRKEKTRGVSSLIPSVTGVAPNTGTAAGGTAVTISGTNFVGASAVRFGTVAPASFTVVNATTITCSSPAHAAGLVDVTVSNIYGTSATGTPDHYTYT